jgi:hypothetical protein
VTARQAGLEAFDNADFRCSEGQGGVIDVAFMDGGRGNDDTTSPWQRQPRIDVIVQIPNLPCVTRVVLRNTSSLPPHTTLETVLASKTDSLPADVSTMAAVRSSPPPSFDLPRSDDTIRHHAQVIGIFPRFFGTKPATCSPSG